MSRKVNRAVLVGARRTRLELEDLRAMADQSGKTRPAVSFDEMNAAKARTPRPRSRGKSAKVQLPK